jgi:hypothetical protein
MTTDFSNTSRRRVLAIVGASTTTALFGQQLVSQATKIGVPRPEKNKALALNGSDTALVFINPQNDVLSEKR